MKRALCLLVTLACGCSDALSDLPCDCSLKLADEFSDEEILAIETAAEEHGCALSPVGNVTVRVVEPPPGTKEQEAREGIRIHGFAYWESTKIGELPMLNREWFLDFYERPDPENAALLIKTLLDELAKECG